MARLIITVVPTHVGVNRGIAGNVVITGSRPHARGGEPLLHNFV